MYTPFARISVCYFILWWNIRIESTTTIAVTAAPPKMIEICVIVKPPSSGPGHIKCDFKVCMECIEKQLWEHVPGSSVTVGISGDVEGVGLTADTAVVVGGVNVVMLLLAVGIDAVTLLLILLLVLVDILCGVLSTLMLVLGTVVVLVAVVLSTV